MDTKTERTTRARLMKTLRSERGGDTRLTVWKPGISDVGAEERLARIREGMAVEDASGERFGRVTYVRTDAAAATASVNPAAMGAHQAPSIPVELTEPLLRVGYLKIEDTRYFRRDFRYFATIDQVLSVGSSVVRLDGHCSDLITFLD
jgi:hypothetical protein